MSIFNAEIRGIKRQLGFPWQHDKSKVGDVKAFPALFQSIDLVLPVKLQVFSKLVEKGMTFEIFLNMVIVLQNCKYNIKLGGFPSFHECFPEEWSF